MPRGSSDSLAEDGGISSVDRGVRGQVDSRRGRRARSRDQRGRGRVLAGGAGLRGLGAGAVRALAVAGAPDRGPMVPHLRRRRAPAGRALRSRGGFPLSEELDSRSRPDLLASLPDGRGASGRSGGRVAQRLGMAPRRRGGPRGPGGGRGGVPPGRRPRIRPARPVAGGRRAARLGEGAHRSASRGCRGGILHQDAVVAKLAASGTGSRVSYGTGPSYSSRRRGEDTRAWK